MIKQRKRLAREHNFEVVKDRDGAILNKRITTIKIETKEELNNTMLEVDEEIEKLKMQIEECEKALGYMEKQKAELLKYKGEFDDR